ncbi:hypothetical protein HaLaN_15450 [Haematococcus lacustris]|uniref:Uncharacterized protein n=1 Tax=Haematococcus lacustris TaxID=44745 RepID=A0A699ZAD2_HAELA|nr:hypothetical protein HaLaN_15450 [Haematococcus lacustris]
MQASTISAPTPRARDKFVPLPSGAAQLNQFDEHDEDRLSAEGAPDSYLLPAIEGEKLRLRVITSCASYTRDEVIKVITSVSYQSSSNPARLHAGAAAMGREQPGIGFRHAESLGSWHCCTTSGTVQECTQLLLRCEGPVGGLAGNGVIGKGPGPPPCPAVQVPRGATRADAVQLHAGTQWRRLHAAWAWGWGHMHSAHWLRPDQVEPLHDKDVQQEQDVTCTVQLCGGGC